MIKIDRIFSVYIILFSYILFCVILLFNSSVFNFNSNTNIFVESEIIIFTFLSALFIFQIYSISPLYYLKLADTLCFVFFISIIFNPFYNFFSFSYQLWLYAFFHFFIIILLQIEKFYLK